MLGDGASNGWICHRGTRLDKPASNSSSGKGGRRSRVSQTPSGLGTVANRAAGRPGDFGTERAGPGAEGENGAGVIGHAATVGVARGCVHRPEVTARSKRSLSSTGQEPWDGGSSGGVGQVAP